MTPVQLAQAECANHEPHGACLGAQLGDKGQTTYCSPKPRCRLSAGERCTYFEECVAPMAEMVKEPRRAKAIQEAVWSYRMAHAVGEGTGRKCPDCGGPLQKYRQVCPACADRRRKATYRDAQNRRRRNGQALSTEVAKKSRNSLGNSLGFGGDFRNPYEDGPHPQNGATSVDMGAPESALAGRSAGR